MSFELILFIQYNECENLVDQFISQTALVSRYALRPLLVFPQNFRKSTGGLPLSLNVGIRTSCSVGHYQIFPQQPSAKRVVCRNWTRLPPGSQGLPGGVGDAGISTVFRRIDRLGEETRKLAAGLRESSGLSLKNSSMGSAEGRMLWENRIPEMITELKGNSECISITQSAFSPIKGLLFLRNCSYTYF